jgi:hypothetical protein
MKKITISIITLLILLTSCEKEVQLNNSILINQLNNSILIKKDSINPNQKQWLDAPDGYASFAQIDYNKDGIDDLIQFDGYDVKIEYTWPGPQFYSGSRLEKSYPIVDNKKIFASKIIVEDFDKNGFDDAFLVSGMDPSGTDWSTCWYCDPILPNNIMFNVDGKSFKVKELSDWKGIWRSATSGDIDNDGDADLLIFTTHQAKGMYNKLLINDGSGNFSVRKSDIDSIEWVDVTEMIDINKDGFLDLVINDIISINNKPHNQFRILWGNGNNFYQSKSTTINITNDMWVLDIDAFDFDKDGFLEIIIAMNYPTGGWNLHMFKTNDNKNYTNITNEIPDNSTNRYAYSNLINIGDIDGNDKIDVYVTDKSKKIRWEFDKTLIRK